MASYWFPRVRGLVKHNRIKYLVFSSIIIQIFFYLLCLFTQKFDLQEFKEKFCSTISLYDTKVTWFGFLVFFFFFQENSTLAVSLRDIEIAKD